MPTVTATFVIAILRGTAFCPASSRLLILLSCHTPVASSSTLLLTVTACWSPSLVPTCQSKPRKVPSLSLKAHFSSHWTPSWSTGAPGRAALFLTDRWPTRRLAVGICGFIGPSGSLGSGGSLWWGADCPLDGSVASFPCAASHFSTLVCLSQLTTNFKFLLF